MGCFFSSPGFTDEHSYLFLARGVVPSPAGPSHDENEAIHECRPFTLAGTPPHDRRERNPRRQYPQRICQDDRPRIDSAMRNPNLGHLDRSDSSQSVSHPSPSAVHPSYFFTSISLMRSTKSSSSARPRITRRPSSPSSITSRTSAGCWSRSPSPSSSAWPSPSPFAARSSDIVQRPLHQVDRRSDLQVLSVTDPLVIIFEVSFYAGIVITFPIILFYVAQFVLPALTPHERRIVSPAILVSFGLFIIGVVFCYFFVLPQTLGFFFGFAKSLQWTPTWQVRDYFAFVTQITLAFGLAFELPIVVVLLVYLARY